MAFVSAKHFQVMDMELGHDGHHTFTCNGTPGHIWNGHHTDTPEHLRELADKEIARAEDILRRAAITLAIAEVREVEIARHEHEKAEQRKARAAATRAKNADPFGFKAAGYTD